MRKSRPLPIITALVFLLTAASADAALLTFNSLSPGNNAAMRQTWLDAIGIAAPAFLEDFESGFANFENVHDVTGLFPLGLVIRDSSGFGEAVIRSGSGVINGSNPVGGFALTHNDDPYLEFDFSLNPVSYFGFQDIDQAGTTGIVTFVGGATENISFETTGAFGDSAEFFGIFNNDMPLITRVQLNGSGDGLWGVDNLEYGVVPEPGSLLLMGLGLAGLAARRRRQT